MNTRVRIIRKKLLPSLSSDSFQFLDLNSQTLILHSIFIILFVLHQSNQIIPITLLDSFPQKCLSIDSYLQQFYILFFIFNSINTILYLNQSTSMSLCSRLGGQPAIKSVVDKFYVYLLIDPRLKHYFENINVPKQRVKLTEFVTMATGGEKTDYVFQMKKKHQNLGITNPLFDAAWENFEKSLNDHNVPKELVEEAKGVFYSVKSDVLSA